MNNDKTEILNIVKPNFQIYLNTKEQIFKKVEVNQTINKTIGNSDYVESFEDI